MTDEPHINVRAGRLVALERALVKVRWFGIVFAIYEVAVYVPNPGFHKQSNTDPTAWSAVALIVFTNLAATWLLHRERDAATLQRAARCIFALDIAALWTLTWAYNFERYGTTWVLLTILCLEGALRYRLRGALVPVLVAIPLEIARRAAASATFGYPFDYSSLLYRVGFMGIIAWVAGFMATDLERARAAAEIRAREHEELALREREAREESAAFQDVILAGVSQSGMHDALQGMLSVIADRLGYPAMVVLLVEDTHLVPVAAHGFARDVAADSLRVGEGIAGAVALTGVTEIVPDVAADPRYYSVDTSTRSQITLAIRAGERIIGVLDVESAHLEAFDAEDAARLERLGAQMGLVIEQARLLAQERNTVEQLMDLETMKADFIAIASHELRTPLTAMHGSIKTLRRPDINLSPEMLQEFLEALDRQSERLGRLIEDLLIVSRIDADSVRVEIEPIDIADVVEDVLAEIGPSRKRVAVTIEERETPFASDQQRLGQIIRNLVENALKFSSPTSTVHLTARRANTATDAMVLEIRDSGHGIAPEELPRIYERFHQVGSSLRRHAEGTGLGLYITRHLIDILGGSIEVDSTIGVGTTFRVMVPAKARDVANETSSGQRM